MATVRCYWWLLRGRLSPPLITVDECVVVDVVLEQIGCVAYISVSRHYDLLYITTRKVTRRKNWVKIDIWCEINRKLLQSEIYKSTTLPRPFSFLQFFFIMCHSLHRRPRSRFRVVPTWLTHPPMLVDPTTQPTNQLRRDRAVHRGTYNIICAVCRALAFLVCVVVLV